MATQDGYGVMLGSILRAMKINPDEMKSKFEEFLKFTKGLHDGMSTLNGNQEIFNARLANIEAQMVQIHTFMRILAEQKSAVDAAEYGAPAPLLNGTGAQPSETISDGE